MNTDGVMFTCDSAGQLLDAAEMRSGIAPTTRSIVAAGRCSDGVEIIRSLKQLREAFRL